VFKDVKVEYYTRLLSEFKHAFVYKGEFIPTIEFTNNKIVPILNKPTIEEFIKKNQIKEKKQELLK
jgi:hypothetical protein